MQNQEMVQNSTRQEDVKLKSSLILFNINSINNFISDIKFFFWKWHDNEDFTFIVSSSFSLLD